MLEIPVAKKAAKGRNDQLTAEMLVNMYAEEAPQGSKSRVVARGCPGLSKFTTLPGRIREMFRSIADGSLYVVAGTQLIRVSEDGGQTVLGNIPFSGRADIAENTTELCIVAGSKGFTYSASDGLQEITDSDFPGAYSVTTMDGYFVFNNRTEGDRGQFFISNLRDGRVYDAADFATAERYPDNLDRVFADHSELILFGEKSTEIWFNAGLADFPFSRAQGSILEQGIGARWSAAKLDESVLWLDDEGIVRRLEGGAPVRVSTHAIEHHIANGDWRNAAAYSYVLEGHQFYVLTIPSSGPQNQAGTYVYDAATKVWHKRQSYGMDVFRGDFYAYAFDRHFVGASDEGVIYEMSTEFMSEASDPMVSEIVFPQVHNDGNRLIVHKFQLDCEVGPYAPRSVVLYDDFTLDAVQNASESDPSVGVTVDGLTKTDHIVVQKPKGLTYQAWSKWAESDNVENEWINTVQATDAEGNTTEYNTSEYPTKDEAEESFSPFSLTGSTEYTFWLQDSGTISDNRDGLSVKITKVPGSLGEDGPSAMLSVSSNDGESYGKTQPWRSLGARGEYQKRVIWRRLGQHFSFTPKVSISDPVRRAVFTAYAEIEPCG